MYCLPLHAAGATLDLVGGKGAALARLASAGLPVPPGFQLTTAAYEQFIASNALQPLISSAIAQLSSADPTAAAQAGAIIQPAFAAGTMPEAVATAIRQAYATLGQGELAVAVRSSATAEDLPELSFAGQQETYLNVRGEPALLAAIQRCWASLWSERAIGYRQRMGIDQQAVAMGVVVQVMVPADVSGILFTANPTTSARDELVINASFGLGEAIVSGAVTPDIYTLDKANLTLKTLVIGTKELMIIAQDDQDTATLPVPPMWRGQRALVDGILHELATLGRRVEQLYDGVPQDIEWAVARERCYILQSRPITNLLPAALSTMRWETPIPGSSWVRRQVVEHMPEPLSPLFAELYLNEGLDRALEVIQRVMGVAPSVYDKIMDRPFFTTINGFAYMRGSIKMHWWTIPMLIPMMARGISQLMGNMGITYWRDEGLPTYLAAVERWRGLDPATASDEQLLQGIRELAHADANYWFACTLAIGTAKIADSMLDSFLNGAAAGRNLSSGLFLRGFPSKTMAAQAELEGIAERIRASETLRALVAATPAQHLLEALAQSADGAVIGAELHGYIEHYGHQIYTLDFAEPTQADDPLPIFVSLKAMVQQPGPPMQTRQAELLREREALVAQTTQSFGPLQRRLFRSLLTNAQKFGPYREEALFYVGSAWPTLRRLAHELGERLVAAGMIATPDDVFYLQRAELIAACSARAAGQPQPELAQLAKERRALREAQKRLHPPVTVPPSFSFRFGPIDLSARESQRRNSASDTTLRGFAVSPGRVTAPASVILSPADFDTMEPGTILVCPITTPAWTPLFAQARGLITDIGGILAHGSIVAREYNIPAVMGTGNATQRIVSGQKVTVDGNLGIVTLE